MRKKLFSIALATALGAALFAGCGSSSDSSSASSAADASSAAEASSASETSEASASGELTGEGKKVTALFFSLEGEYFTQLDGWLKEGLEAKGYEYESQSSNFDAVTQIEQIENATAGGTTALWVWASDGRQVADALKNAREQGVIVYSFVQDPGEGASDMVRGTDEEVVGTTLAELAIEWIDENKPDAADGSVRTVFISNENSEEQKTRCDTAIALLEQDSRIDMLEVVVSDGTTVTAQSTAENLFTKYNGGIDLIVSSGGEDALGVCAYLDSESCVAEDPVAIGNVSVEITTELADYMNRGIYDACAVNGGNIYNNIQTQVDELDKLINGEIEGGFSAVEVGRCTPDTLADFGY